MLAAGEVQATSFICNIASAKAWGVAELIETGNTAAGAGQPKIAMDASGNASAVWRQDDGTRVNIWANRYTAGLGWGTRYC